MNNRITTLLFDLGGVLVDWDGTQPLLDLTQNRLSPDEARRFWLESPWVRRFETGACSPEDFAAGAVAELEVSVSPQVFLAAFATWDRGPTPEAFTLLERCLQSRYALYCLSNNNEVHWQHPELRRLLQYFKRTFVSYEIGLVKPDAAVFAHVIEHIPESPDRILFFDDNPECITGAQNAGLQARQVQGCAAVSRVIEEIEKGGIAVDDA